MPRVCGPCRHPETAIIASLLVSGTPYRTISLRYGLSKTALIRHRKHADLSAAAATAAAAVEPAVKPIEPVPLGNAREVQLDVQRRLLVQFTRCEERKDSRGCALLAVQIRLNAEWLRADAEEAPGAEPPVRITFVFPEPNRPTRPLLEVERVQEGLALDAAASESEVDVVSPSGTDDEISDRIVDQIRERR